MSKLENEQMDTRKSRRWFIFFQIHDADKRQVAEILVEIKTISKHEFVGDFKTSIMDRYHRFASFRLIEQGTDLKAARLADLQQFQHRGDCVTAIHNVFNEEYV